MTPYERDVRDLDPIDMDLSEMYVVLQQVVNELDTFKECRRTRASKASCCFYP